MNILVVGGGGREHAIVSSLVKSRFGPMLYAAPGNGGISECAVCLDIKETDAGGIVRAAIDNSIDVAIVSSEQALAAGVTDELEAHGIRAFGPRKNAAVIGVSRTLAKQLLNKYDIPSVGYGSFDNFAEAEAFIAGIKRFPAAVKSDGLSLRSSVIVGERSEAVDVLRSMAAEKMHLSAGSRVIVEEYGDGAEYVVPVLSDGKSFLPMPGIFRYKRALDGDEGENTDGMGAVCPPPFPVSDAARRCADGIFKKTFDALNAEGRTFRGILQFVLRIDGDDVRAVDFSPCIGDPEAETLLLLLETDLVDIINTVIDGTLFRADVRYSHRFGAAVVAAGEGYPSGSSEDAAVTGCESFPHEQGIALFHMDTRYKDGALVTAGGRAFAVAACADTLDSAAYKAYQNVSRIRFDGVRCRNDVGKFRS